MTESEDSPSSVYVDTSAIARMLLDEPDKPAIEQQVEDFDQRVASRLLRVELRRVGAREGVLERADLLLADISLVSVDEQILAAAETISPTTVGTLDAIHLATAVHLAKAGELDALMTYDKRLADGAREHGITVLSPS
ncbi:MAG: type II toxin-antitoxin system VapC family toxin [Solirubrobacteraceae bacterium]